jgi:hypothetical protein
MASGRGRITFLQLLEALEGDFEFIGRVEWRGVVLDLDTKERYDRHGGGLRRPGACVWDWGERGVPLKSVVKLYVGVVVEEGTGGQPARCVYLGAVRDVRVVINRGRQQSVDLSLWRAGESRRRRKRDLAFSRRVSSE